MLLIDFQPIKQPWPLDAAYLQVLCSADPERPGFKRLITRMAESRRKRGMNTGSDVDRTSRITLAWSAISRWGCDLDRHAVLGYRQMLNEYIEAA